jgi:hypothetical protein
MRHIEVKYRNGIHAFVDDYLLESLIRSGQITHFHRPSERRWIEIGVDPIRQEESPHPGKERRRTGHLLEMIPLFSDPTRGNSLPPGRI